MQFRFGLLCVLCLFASSGAHPAYAQSQTALLRQTIAALTLDDPQKDMFAHVKSGDYQAVGVCGIACYAPGLEDQADAQNEIVVKYGLRILRGTSDVIESAEQEKLTKTARTYAYSYNLALKNWLEFHQKLHKN